MCYEDFKEIIISPVGIVIGTENSQDDIIKKPCLESHNRGRVKEKQQRNEKIETVPLSTNQF